MTTLTWIGIAFCITQSAAFSGLNLAFFSVSKLKLEVEATRGNKKARRIQHLRHDANFLLTTILWGNVGINVLLTLLSNSVLAGVAAFLFSTVVITFAGEIIPQAYFSRHAIAAGYLLSPFIRFYQVVLFPVAKPTAMLLDLLLGKESIQYFRESDFRELIRMHVKTDETDIAEAEGTGAINFLMLDDLTVADEGEELDPASIIRMKTDGHCPAFPKISREPTDPFLVRLNESGRKWVVAVDDAEQPHSVINANSFLRDALWGGDGFSPQGHCHRPILVTDLTSDLGDLLLRLQVHPEHHEDDVVDEDLILVWTPEAKKIITGSDILGRLLRGIVTNKGVRYRKK